MASQLTHIWKCRGERTILEDLSGVPLVGFPTLQIKILKKKNEITKDIFNTK